MASALTAGCIDSGVETGNESSDIDINISQVMDEGNNETLNDAAIHVSVSNVPYALSNVSSLIGNFVGSRLSVGGNEQSENGNKVPPPPPPTSPNICIGNSEFSMTANIETEGVSLHENVDGEFEFTGNGDSPVEGGSDKATEMDRDFNEDEADNDDIRDDAGNCDSSISPPLNDAKEMYGRGSFGDQSFEFHLSASRDNGPRSRCNHNVFPNGSFFNNGYHQRSLYCPEPPPPPPVTPTNTCKALIKFEFPELPKLVCQFVEPPAGLRSYLTLEPFQTDNSTGYDILQGSNPTECRAILPYDQHDIRQKVRSRPRVIRNKLYKNCVRKEQLTYSSSHNERRLRTAAHAGIPQMVTKVLKAGVNPNAMDEHGRTALHIAACKGNSEIIRLLLQSGADPNQKDTVGNTPLHLAACTHRFEAVTCLLRAGTDIRTLDNHGRNPLQLAQSKLKLLATSKCDTGDSIKVKMEVQQIIEMMLEYLQQRGQDVEAELLNSFASRLTLSQTPEEVDADVKHLLANLSSLSITPNSEVSSQASIPAVVPIHPTLNPYLAFNLNQNLSKTRLTSFMAPSTSSTMLPSSSSPGSSNSIANHSLSSNISFGIFNNYESQREQKHLNNCNNYRDKKNNV